jgi:hypothetical protein
MLRRLIVAGATVVALTAGAATSAMAQEQWVLLGKKQIATNSGKDSEAIDVSEAKGNFKAIRLITKETYIEISNVEVLYGGGQAHNEKRTMSMNPNDRTRPINPSEQGKFVERVSISYKPSKEKTPTLVEVYGLQTSDGARAARSASNAAPAAAPSSPFPPSSPAPSASAPTAAPKAVAAATNIPTAPTAPEKAKELRPGDQNEQGDVLFGTQTVGFGVDRDVIRIGADVGKFDKIRMRVLDNDIFVRSMKVVYADGTGDEIAYNADIKANSRTRWIDLKGDRFIKEIQLIYNSKPSVKGRAFIEVYGQYAEGWLGPQGEGKKYNQGFVLLGAQSAGFTIDRNDKIPVGKNEGGFKKIRVSVKDEAITLFEVRVIYGNGEIDVIPANRTRVDAGGTYGPIDLKGGSRIIQEIRPTYRTRIFQQGGVARGRAVVEFWGQH